MGDDIGKLLDRYFTDNTIIMEMLSRESDVWGDENAVFYMELPYISGGEFNSFMRDALEISNDVKAVKALGKTLHGEPAYVYHVKNSKRMPFVVFQSEV